MMRLADVTRQIFSSRFGYQPALTVQAPGRVNLIGEHTDYNDGFVLPCAINYQTVISAAKRNDTLIRVIAVDYQGQQDQFSLDEEITPNPSMPWANYVRGVIKQLLTFQYPFAGADLVISGNVPQGAGLSSSASLEVAVGKALQELYQLPLDGAALALNGQQAENLFVGCRCGIMDQMISALGEKDHALLLDCRSLTTQAIRIPDELAVVIIDSNVKRGLVDSEYNTRRAQCEEAARFFAVPALRDVSMAQFTARAEGLPPVVAQRARHVISENQRTREAARALLNADLQRIGALMRESHISMRDDFAITVPAIDTLVELVQQTIGERGGVRMTGGGFGGCIVALVPQDLVEQIREVVAKQYQQLTGLQETFYVCNASPGACRC